VNRKHFETFAHLERQMDMARQLRAETLGGAAGVLAGYVAAVGTYLWLRLVTGELHRRSPPQPRSTVFDHFEEAWCRASAGKTNGRGT
jgi:hypothetical protein